MSKTMPVSLKRDHFAWWELGFLPERASLHMFSISFRHKLVWLMLILYKKRVKCFFCVCFEPLNRVRFVAKRGLQLDLSQRHFIIIIIAIIIIIIMVLTLALASGRDFSDLKVYWTERAMLPLCLVVDSREVGCFSLVFLANSLH